VTDVDVSEGFRSWLFNFFRVPTQASGLIACIAADSHGADDYVSISVKMLPCIHQIPLVSLPQPDIHSRKAFEDGGCICGAVAESGACTTTPSMRVGSQVEII